MESLVVIIQFQSLENDFYFEKKKSFYLKIAVLSCTKIIFSID